MLPPMYIRMCTEQKDHTHQKYALWYYILVYTLLQKNFISQTVILFYQITVDFRMPTLRMRMYVIWGFN